MGYIIAADVGGTKLATALFSENGTLLKALEIPTEKNDGEKLFVSLIELLKSLCLFEGITVDKISGIAVGLPGIVDVEKGIAIFQNNLPWRDFPLAERLVNTFPKSKVTVDNDVYMAAWGEYITRGLSKESLVYVTLSTGISSCSIENGQFLRGAGMAGEIGFNLIEASEGTLETVVSGPALELRGRKEFNDPELTLKEMMEFYYEGNERIVSIVNGAIITLAKEVYHILVYSDPHCIVLGGGVFNNHPILVKAVQSEVKQYLQHPMLRGKEERIEASVNKGEAGLRGAALRIMD